MNRFYAITSLLFKDTASIILPLFRIMIPITIGLKALSYTPALQWVSLLFEPVMAIIGLPPQTAFAWVTAIFTNIYGGLIVLSSTDFATPLTVGQLSILGSCFLFAHNLPVELKIAKLAGLPISVGIVFRLGISFLYAWLCHLTFSAFDLFQTPPHTFSLFTSSAGSTLTDWALKEGLNYAKVSLIIFCLVIIMKLFNALKITDLFKFLMRPILKLFGISDHSAHLIIIGWIMGMAYGGMFIAKESKSHLLTKHDCIISILLLSLTHSFLEDTALILVMGGNIWPIFIIRNLLVFILIIGISKGLRAYFPGLGGGGREDVVLVR